MATIADYQPILIDENLSGNKYTGASDKLAQIHRAQWNDWKERFAPRLEQLARYAMTGELTTKGIGLADQAMQDSYAGMEKNQAMHRNSLGIHQSGAQKAVSDRNNSLAMASSRVAARNQARVAGQDRDMQILAGGAGLSSDLVQS